MLHNVVPPVGLLYIAASVRRSFPSRYEIKVIDMRFHRLSAREMEGIIRDFRPDIIGCSVISCENDCMNELANLTKRIDENIKFIVGGPHPTMYYSDVLGNGNIDIVVIGEAEVTICELLESLEGNKNIDCVPGIAYRKEGQIAITKSRGPISDLDTVAFPAWDLIPLTRYSDFNQTPMGSLLAGTRYSPLFTSRGCPYQCIYCHDIFGKEFRKRSAQNVFKEIEELYHKYHVDEFHIFDDIFNFDRDRVKEICDLIIASGIKIWISFPNGLRGDILDDELLSKMKSAGTYSITLALETASPRLQKSIKKNINIEKLVCVINAADKLGILTKCFFMLGFPDETIAEVKKTIRFACKSRLCLANFHIVTPQKTTELYDMVKSKNPQFALDLDRTNYYISDKAYKEKIVKLPLERLLATAYLKFFLNPRRLIKIWSRTKRKIYLVFGSFYMLRLFYHYFLKRSGEQIE